MLIRKVIAATAMAASVVLLASSSAFAIDEPDDPNEGVEREVTATYNGRTIDLGEDWESAQICTEVAEGDMRCYDTAEDEQRDLADESLGHALAAEAAGLKVPGALSAKGMKHRTLREYPSGAAGASSNGPAGEIGVLAIADCPFGYGCLFDSTSYSGRILRFASGGKNLADYKFRDKAGSVCNNKARYGVELKDFRTGLPDPMYFQGVGYCSRLHLSDYAYGGNWNNKADYMIL
ncbi:peptidase inhibitor family I36 protein [Streptomyces cyaneofuscatus]|uniref:peptidase inhibitor family I36 protein n=1 Tax=Streptomyces cyaneofuscatus TaxID=66883 RepID=UPI0036D7CE9D